MLLLLPFTGDSVAEEEEEKDESDVNPWDFWFRLLAEESEFEAEAWEVGGVGF
jgi:hypothetical protein